MSSPRWSATSATPVAAAIAAAAHYAWQRPERQRTAAFHDALRKMVGPTSYERIHRSAQDVFLLQGAPPADFAIPPQWAWFTICPGCQSLKRTKYTAPQNGRLKLQVLRDKEWLADQFEAGRSAAEIAKRLDCTGSLVDDWAAKHGLLTPKAASQQELEAVVRRMHQAGEAPGTIAKYLRDGGHHYIRAGRVREILSRLGLATLKRGQVYHDREWWRVRLEDRRLTASACAKEAGIEKHAALYWTNRFGLKHVTEENRKRGKPKRYPELYSATQLRALLARNGDNYEAAARAIGCTSPSLISRQARKLLGWEKRHENHPPHGDREWWAERIDRGVTAAEIADEIGVAEKTAIERARRFDLAGALYANATRRERQRRASRTAA